MFFVHADEQGFSPSGSGFCLCFFESQRLRRELMRQTEAKGRALAAAIETSARNAILGNSLLEEQISHWLLDNARLIDELLFYPAADQDLLK
jgi:hypothetical protein